MIVGLFQKNLNGGLRTLRTHFFLKKTWIFEVCHFTLGNYGQNKAFFTLGNSVKLCYTPWKFQGQKPRLMKMHHDFFLITPKWLHFYLWKFWTKQSFTFGNSVKLCCTLWSPLEIALLFQLTPKISTWYFFNTPGNSMSSTPLPPPLFGFLPLSLYIYIIYCLIILKRGLGWNYGSEVERS